MVTFVTAVPCVGTTVVCAVGIVDKVVVVEGVVARKQTDAAAVIRYGVVRERVVG